MRSALAAFAIAAAVAAVLTPIVRLLASNLGVVDQPGGRRVHTRVIPRLGGIAVVLAFFAPLLALFALKTGLAHLFFADPERIAGLAAGGLLVAGLGMVDDIVGVRALHKLGIQTIAGVIAYAAGFRMEAIGLPVIGNVHFGWMAAPITVFWIVGVINALNLIDGLDGLAAGIAFFACITNFVVASINGLPLVMLLSAALGGAILGFLLYNFNPATIFMGDSGSMFLGFALATTSMMGSSVQGSTTVAILVPILSLGVPVVDTLFAMVRRFLERRPIFSPDRGHIHHRLLDLGITHRRAVLILYGISVLLTAGAITVALGRNWEVGLALLLVTIAMVGLVRFVGYFEYVQIRRRQREHVRSESTTRFRHAVPPLLLELRDAPDVESVMRCLGDFAKAADMDSAVLVAPPGGRLPAISWIPVQPGEEGAAQLVGHARASYPLPLLGAGVALKFAWRSKDAEVSPQADILLQLVADALERRVEELQPTIGPSGSVAPVADLDGHRERARRRSQGG